MSNTAKFFVRRDDVNYRVKDFETLLRWLGEGRLCGTDLIFDVEDGAWHRLRHWPPIAAQWQTLKVERQSVEHPPRTYWVHRNGESVSVPSLERLLTYAEAGKLAVDDLIMHPGLDSWFRVDASPALFNALPEAMRQNSRALLPVVLDPFATVHDEPSIAGILSESEDISSAAEAPKAEPATDEAALSPEMLFDDVTETTEDGPLIMTGMDFSVDTSDTSGVTSESFVHLEADMTDFSESPTHSEDGPPSLADTFSIFYKIARIHVVIRELRPGTKIAGTCPDPMDDRDWKGAEKVEVFVRLRTILEETAKTLNGDVADSVVRLAQTLADCESIVGQKPPHRLVIGNRAGPKMTVEEQTLMAAFDAGLKDVFAHKPT